MSFSIPFTLEASYMFMIILEFLLIISAGYLYPYAMPPTKAAVLTIISGFVFVKNYLIYQN